jgi:tetratricopeptide (TPR) repeat protein
VAPQADKARQHFDEGQQRAQAGQWVSAAASFRLAVAFAPGDRLYQSKLAEAEQQVAAVQAANYFKRGQFEEKAGRHDAAARCYERSEKLQTGATVAIKASQTNLHIRQLKKAMDYARKAVDLEPGNPQVHVALAMVFRENRHFDRALQALEIALRIEPSNVAVQRLLKEVKAQT